MIVKDMMQENWLLNAGKNQKMPRSEEWGAELYTFLRPIPPKVIFHPGGRAV